MATGRTAPNIVLVMSDEHAAPLMGCMGRPYVCTPNLDRLAADGVLFENAYCPYALCVPSRSSCLTGLLPHRIGVYDNGCPCPSDIPTWAHMLSAAGYRTHLVGKMHFIGPDRRHGFEGGVCDGPYPVSGFHWGQTEPAPEAYRTFTACRVDAAVGEACADARRRDAAVAFIRDAEPGRPFCLTVGFDFPHYPHQCTPEALAPYEAAAIPEPLEAGRLSERNRRWREDVWKFHRIAPEETRRLRRIYLAMVSMMDGWVGDVRSALAARGLLEDTVFIYTADHGEMWGEHGMWGKNLFYEESSRIPLIVAAPGLGVGAGRRIRTPVSLVDLYPTLRDIGGPGDWDAALDGRSLWPALRGGEPLADLPVFCEYYGSEVSGPERMVRLGPHKLNRYDDGELELFDLEADPRETTNLAQRSDMAGVRERLRSCLLDGWDPGVIAGQVRASQRRRVLVARGRARAPERS